MKFITFLFLTSIFIFAKPLVAADNQNKESLLQYTPPEECLKNEVITFMPRKGHHFNLDSPLNCAGRDFFVKTKDRLRCQITKPGINLVNVFICDDANKYCKQESFTIRAPGEDKITKLPSKKPKTTATIGVQKVEHEKELPGFYYNLKEAKKLAKKQKKNMLIIYSSEGCPPCEQLARFTFPTPEFAKGTNKYIKVYVDARDPTIANDMDEFDLYFTPTILITNSRFQEMNRFGGYFPATAFLTKLQFFENFGKETIQEATILFTELKQKENRTTTENEKVTLLAERLGLWNYYSMKYEKAVELLADNSQYSDTAKIAYWDAKSELAFQKHDIPQAVQCAEKLIEISNNSSNSISSSSAAELVYYNLKYQFDDKKNADVKKLTQLLLPKIRSYLQNYSFEKYTISKASMKDMEASLLDILDNKEESEKTKQDYLVMLDKQINETKNMEEKISLEFKKAYSLKDKKKEEAKKMVIALLQKYANNPDVSLVYSQAADFYYNLEEFDSAKAYAEKVIDSGKTEASKVFAKILRARIAIKMKENDFAIQSMQTLLSQLELPASPRSWVHSYAGYARKTIAEAKGKLLK